MFFPSVFLPRDKMYLLINRVSTSHQFDYVPTGRKHNGHKSQTCRKQYLSSQSAQHKCRFHWAWENEIQKSIGTVPGPLEQREMSKGSASVQIYCKICMRIVLLFYAFIVCSHSIRVVTDPRCCRRGKEAHRL